MKKLSRTFLSLFLCAALCLGLFPANAHAEEEAPDTGETVEETAAPAEPAADAQPEEQEPAAQAEETVDAASAAQPNADGAPIADADFNDGKMHYTISVDGVLTITGTGAMPDWSESVHAPWYAFRSQVNSITVGEGITALGAYAFYQLSSATTVDLPDTLTSLGIYCFNGSGIQAITLPEEITSIPTYAFCGCSALTSIDIPDSVRIFGDYAFYGCSSLQSIVIPEGVTELRAYDLFEDCSSLKSIVLPGSLKKLGYSWMFNCTTINNIYFNGSLEQWLGIQFNAGNNSGLPMRQPCNLYISGEKLTSLTVPEGVQSIPAYAFQYVNLTGVLLTDSVTSIGTNAFANCSTIKKVFFVGDQTAWSSIAFNSGNDSLIDAPRYYIDSVDDVRTITALPAEHGTVTVSDSFCLPGDEVTVTATPEIGYRLSRILVNGTAIDGSSFVVRANTDYTVTAEFEFYRNTVDYGTCGADLTWFLTEDNELVITGTGTMDSFNSNSAPWSKYRGVIAAITVENGTTSIGSYAFSGCSLVQSIILPESVKTIGSYAFQGCGALKEIRLPAGLEFIGNWAFANCQLQSIYYGGTVANWCAVQFNSITGLFSGSNVLFYINDEPVIDLMIPAGVTQIASYAFCGYRALRSVVFPDGLKTIAVYAFYNCSNLQSIVLPERVELIGQDAFYGCSSLTYAEFLGDAPSVRSEAFPNGSNFVIYYHQGTTGWSSPKWYDYYAACVEAFSDYSALDADNRNAQGILFTLNDSARTAIVGDGSDTDNNSGYYGAQKGAVVIPDAVTKEGTIYRVIGIGPCAFRGSKLVTSVSVGAGVSSIIPSAFRGCPNLQSFAVSAENEFYSARDGVLYDAEALYLYAYPGGKTDSSFTVPESVKTIGQGAFCDNSHLQTLTVGRNVTAIYSKAFCGLDHLSEITLPFIGVREPNEDEGYYSQRFGEVFYSGTYGKNPVSDFERYNNATGEWEVFHGSLKKVTILGGSLYQQAFEGCGGLEEIRLPSVPEEIPYRCFYNCVSLRKLTFANQNTYAADGKLILPEGVKTVSHEVFYGCKDITGVFLPATLTNIESSAFSASGLEEFTVASGNKNYSADKWGVLYNKDKTALIQYPPCRRWPYYNVADTATAISSSAFSGCKTLVNLYVPKTVTLMGAAVKNCPNMTLCCYMYSAAYYYALNNNITAWYLDNKTLQGISVYHLPEQSVQVQGREDWTGLYIVGNYGGKELQIDDYTLSFDRSSSGVKTVTVEYGGKTVTFEIVYYTSAQGNVIAFRCDDQELNGRKVLIAVYDARGAMLASGTATIVDGEAQLGVNDSVFANAAYAKLFILDGQTYAPMADAQVQTVR